MQCRNCGTTNGVDARVCVSCQQPLSGVWQAPGSRPETTNGANRRARIILVTLLVIAAAVGAAWWGLMSLVGAANSRD
jgi:hypothetical protein